MAVPEFGQSELGRFTQTFTELFDAADAESMTSYYTGQAQLMAEGMTPVQGHTEIGPLLASGHQPGPGRRGQADHSAARVTLIR
jgi:hypothetical protein